MRSALALLLGLLPACALLGGTGGTTLRVTPSRYRQDRLATADAAGVGLGAGATRPGGRGRPGIGISVGPGGVSVGAGGPRVGWGWREIDPGQAGADAKTVLNLCGAEPAG